MLRAKVKKKKIRQSENWPAYKYTIEINHIVTIVLSFGGRFYSCLYFYGKTSIEKSQWYHQAKLPTVYWLCLPQPLPILLLGAGSLCVYHDCQRLHLQSTLCHRPQYTVLILFLSLSGLLRGE